MNIYILRWVCGIEGFRDKICLDSSFVVSTMAMACMVFDSVDVLVAFFTARYRTHVRFVAITVGMVTHHTAKNTKLPP